MCKLHPPHVQHVLVFEFAPLSIIAASVLPHHRALMEKVIENLSCLKYMKHAEERILVWDTREFIKAKTTAMATTTPQIKNITDWSRLKETHG